MLGTLLVAGRTGPQSRFRRDERALFEALCGHAAVALLAAELVDQLREEVSRRESEALHDGLTGLRNRRAFAADCARAIGRSAETGRGLALAVVDLDLFKEVNDTLGHAFGDLLLAEVATRLAEAARPGEVVARLGGDEFALLVPDVVDEEGALRAVRRLVDSLGRPLSLDGVRLAVSATAGVTLAPRDGDTPDSLLRRADVALYTGKRRGSGLEVYSRTDDVSSRRRLDLLAELTHAMDEGQVWVAYQPKARTSDGVVTGVEALARWDSPRFGSVGPAEFVPLVETNGQLRRLTSHVLDTALAQVARWQVAGPPRRRRRQHLHAGARGRAPGRRGGGGAGPRRCPRRAADAGDHRGQRHGRGEPEPGVAAAPGRAGRAPGGRRLRHRLVLAVLPHPAAGRRGEDRPQLRAGHEHGPGRRGGRLQHRGAGARAGPAGRGRGGGGPGRVGPPRRARLRRGAGLPAAPAGRGGGGHPLARAAAPATRRGRRARRPSVPRGPAGDGPDGPVLRPVVGDG